MSRTKVGSLIVLCLLVAALVRAAANSEVVTNPTPAVNATMELTSSSGEAFFWTVRGKIKPAYRGFGATVKLLCEEYATLEAGGVPRLIAGDQNNVDACGNFSFNAVVAGPSPQLDPSFVCFFVVHVDGNSAPQACSSKSTPPDAFPQDPNGTAPCSGGLCPNAP